MSIANLHSREVGHAVIIQLVTNRSFVLLILSHPPIDFCSCSSRPAVPSFRTVFCSDLVFSSPSAVRRSAIDVPTHRNRIDHGDDRQHPPFRIVGRCDYDRIGRQVQHEIDDDRIETGKDKGERRQRRGRDDRRRRYEAIHVNDAVVTDIIIASPFDPSLFLSVRIPYDVGDAIDIEHRWQDLRS